MDKQELNQVTEDIKNIDSECEAKRMKLLFELCEYLNIKYPNMDSIMIRKICKLLRHYKESEVRMVLILTKQKGVDNNEK